MSSRPSDGPPTNDVTEPISYFLTDLEYHGRTERTRESYQRVLTEFDEFLDTEFDGVSLEHAGHRHCLSWMHSLRARTSPSTVATYASYLNRFYDYMVRAEVFEENPMGLVMEEMDESIDTDPERRDISVAEMREFVSSISHPLDRAIVVTFLKTGVRVGELCNLDLQDVAVETPQSLDVGTRTQLEAQPRTLYVDADIARGSDVNGEVRTAANKRVRSTLIPIDDELAVMLRRWLAIRPDSVSSAQPLFTNPRRDWGSRLTPDAVRRLLTKHTTEIGWYSDGGDASENVTPHYFRHFFTTHLRDRTGDRGVVKYIRGDVAEDIIDTYTHNWGDTVRSVYESNIYSLL